MDDKYHYAIVPKRNYAVSFLDSFFRIRFLQISREYDRE